MISRRLLRITARELVDSPIFSVDERETLIKAIKLMVENEADHIVIKDKDIIKGILTINDILKELHRQESDISNIPLYKLEYRSIPIVKADTKILDLIKVMINKNTSLLFVSYKGKIEGIIKLPTILKIVSDIIEDLMRQLDFERKPIIQPANVVMGYCDRCGVWSDDLNYKDGFYYCPDCIADIYGLT